MTTLAERIRAEAVERGYWSMEEYARLSERRDIGRVLGCKTVTVTLTLKRSSKLGKPRNPALTRCEKCGQALPTQPEAHHP